MYAWRRKKKVIEQLNAFFASVDSQKTATTPLPSVPPIAHKPTTPKPISSPVSKSDSGSVDMSLSEMMRMVKEGNNKTSTQSQSLTDIYGTQNTTIDVGKVQELWVRFSRSIESQDTHLYSLMQQIPTVENGTCVVAVVSNNMQASKLRESSELINFLRQQTGVPSLTLDVRVVANESNATTTQDAIAYTPKQKLDQMIADNKSIGLLVETFSLDVEF